MTASRSGSGGGRRRRRWPIDREQELAARMRGVARREPQSWRAEHGVTALEYALVGSLVALAIIAGVSALGGELGGAYDRIASAVLDVLN